MTGEGNCFEIAVLQACFDKEATVCHGMPLGQGPIAGLRHSHAWIEHTDEDNPDLWLVTDLSNGKRVTGMPADLYYYYGRIDPAHVLRYTATEARRLAVEHGHYGPWDQLDG